MLDQERSYSLWQLCESANWQHLPRAGGWEDQDAVFLHDARVISRRLSYLRRRKKEDREIHDKVADQMGLDAKTRKRLWGKN